MSKKKIKVAQIIGIATDGGVESTIFNYYKHIDRTKVQFDFFVESESNIISKKTIEELGGDLYIIPSYKNVFKYIGTLVDLFKKNKYDIVHSNMNTLSVFSLYAAKKAGVKIRIAHSHSTSSIRENFIYIIKLILKLFSKAFATHFFSCSKEAGVWMFGKKIVNNPNFYIINNALEVERFVFNDENRTIVRKELGVSENTFLIGNIGRLVKQKNHLFLLKLFKELLNINSNYMLMIIGEGKLKKILISYAKKNNIDSKLIFIKTCKNVERFYSAMDCFVFPSIYEGLGMVFVEAQINGLKSIGSTAIPEAALINSNSVLISLKSKNDEWKKEIICASRVEFNNEILKTKGYDISVESKNLLKIYSSQLNIGGDI